MYVGQRRLQTYPSTAGAQWGRVWDPQTRCVCTGTAFWDCQSPLISNASEEIFHSPFCCPLFPELSEHAGSPCSSLPITNVTSPSAAPELAVLAGSHGQKQQLTLFSPVCHTGNPKAITSIFCRKKNGKMLLCVPFNASSADQDLPPASPCPALHPGTVQLICSGWQWVLFSSQLRWWLNDCFCLPEPPEE